MVKDITVCFEILDEYALVFVRSRLRSRQLKSMATKSES